MTVTSKYVDFVSTFDPVNIGREGDNTILYLGANNTLYWPNGEMTIGSLRAYFQLNGLTASHDPSQKDETPVRAFILNLGDGETSGITTTYFTNSDGAWFDLSGRKLDGKPSYAGVYINNGKKIVIKKFNNSSFGSAKSPTVGTYSCICPHTQMIISACGQIQENVPTSEKALAYGERELPKFDSTIIHVIRAIRCSI